MSSTDSSKPKYYSSTYRHGVDDKRRVQIPAKWRPDDEGVELTLILWPNEGLQGPCLRILPPKQMEALMAKIEAMPSADPEAVALRRNIARDSDQASIDKAGRICIPERMAQLAGLEKEAILAGALQWFEIWNPDRYTAASAVDQTLSPGALKRI
ncbi:MAG: hypothetical protein HYZ36_07630 [Pedosphaera parvula]|nr:hypothetical protein [Pedosphaera parvula]